MSQITILTGPERRRRWSAEEQHLILSEAFSPGAVVTQVARRFDCSTSLIYKWRNARRAAARGERFAPVVLVEDRGRSSTIDSPVPAIIVELAGARVSIGATAPAILVAAALRALR